jgi:hypothetical protein
MSVYLIYYIRHVRKSRIMGKTHYESERRMRPRSKPYKRRHKIENSYMARPVKVGLEGSLVDTVLNDYLDDETVEEDSP